MTTPPPLPRYPFIFKCSSVSLLPNGPHDTKRSCLPLLSKVQGITSQTCLSERIFTLSFNTNLLIPSNASLYITMYNQLYDYQEQREGGEAMPICIIHWKIFKKKQLRKKRQPLHLNKRKKCQGLNLLRDMKLQNKLSKKRD